MQSGSRASETEPVTMRRFEVGVGAGLAVAVGVALIALRVANDGTEPEGRNWWMIAAVTIGVAFLPAGGFLLSYPNHRRLGASFVVVGATQLAAALANQWEAYSQPADSGDAVAYGGAEVIEAVGLLVLVGVVPWFLPWRTPRGRGDPLKVWLAVGVVASVAGALCALPQFRDVPGVDVVGPLLLMIAAAVVTLGAVVEAVRDERERAATTTHRFLVWTVLGVGIAVAYTIVVAGFGALLGADGPAWLLVACTAGIAIALEPARRLVRDIVDRLVYGERDDPLALVRGVMQQMMTADDVTNLLPAVTATLGTAMRLDFVAIDVRTESEPDGQRLACFGSPTANVESLDLQNRDDPVGFLVIGWRDGSGLRARDRRVLDDIVAHVTMAVMFVELTADLHRSNLAGVNAREDERRRLRRDLHDGLGPSLTGIGLGLRSVAKRLQRDAVAHETIEMLERWTCELDGASEEVKRIVRGLRPTALDDHGLCGALREFVLGLDNAIVIDLALPPNDSTLPAAVEIAVYRITTEALTNVVRHAHASRCRVELAIGNHVELDITDDGVGIPDPRRSGIGLQAMRERVRALGGTLAVTGARPHGTQIHARLPVEFR